MKLYIEHAAKFYRHEHLACTWSMLSHVMREYGWNRGHPLKLSDEVVSNLVEFTIRSLVAVSKRDADDYGADAAAAAADDSNNSGGGSSSLSYSGPRAGSRWGAPVPNILRNPTYNEGAATTTAASSSAGSLGSHAIGLVPPPPPPPPPSGGPGLMPPPPPPPPPPQVGISDADIEFAKNALAQAAATAYMPPKLQLPDSNALATGPMGARELANICYGLVVTLGLPLQGHPTSNERMMVKRLFESASKPALLRSKEFKPQELANTVWAFSKAAYRAPSFFDAAAVRAIEWLKQTDFGGIISSNRSVGGSSVAVVGGPGYNSGGGADGGSGAMTMLGEFETVPNRPFLSQELTNILYAFARAAHQAPDLYATVAQPVVQACRNGRQNTALCEWSVQDVCNTLWSYAAADARHPELLHACVSQLVSGHLRDNVQRSHLTQIQQFLIWWELELRMGAQSSSSGGGPPLSQLIDQQLRERCRRALAEGDDVAGHTTSALQREVGRGLERLGYRYTNEFVTPEGYSLDMAITEHGPQWIAVEADGPHHFASDGSPNGATLLKRRQLANLGWKLVPVRYDEWYALERDLMREDAFLRAAIANATGQPVSNIGINNMQQQPHWQAPIMQPAAASAIAANYMAAKQKAAVRPFGGAW